MASSTLHLPDGQTFTVQSVFAGFFFKSHELNKSHQSHFPIGWTIVIHTEDDAGCFNSIDDAKDANDSQPSPVTRTSRLPSFTTVTLQNDSLYISSISEPCSSDFKPAASPTRQIAMMLWITLYWYFHQPPPDDILPANDATKNTPLQGRPRGEWKVYVKRDGLLRGRNLIPRLERMGLIATLDSAVATSLDDTGEEWETMFVSQKMFWQTPARLFLYTLQPANRALASHLASPYSSRPSSPVRNNRPQSHDDPMSPGLLPLQAYYPPAPAQYTFSNNVRHPVRPKPPRMGELFYTRFIPSVGRYLSFRVASCSPSRVPYCGPVSSNATENQHASTLCDMGLVQTWLSHPRVAKFWGGYTSNFLKSALDSRHSYPVIGMWDGIPFGYFEIYWVKEDILGRYVDADDWDRGLHLLVGEEWARGRVPSWLHALVHYILCADYKTKSVCIEPRVDNERLIQHLQRAGFVKEKEITFPHKQAWFGRLRRENWDGPSL